MMLPAVIAHQDICYYKAQMEEKINLILEAHLSAQSQGIWIVDTTLDDHSGSPKLSSGRLPRIIDFHRKLALSLAKGTSVYAGPYWLLNLILWARGLVSAPVIGLGKGYRHYISGGVIKEGKRRIALDSFKRQVIVDPILLGKWIDDALDTGDLEKEVVSELRRVRKNLTVYEKDKTKARLQIAHTYRTWIDGIQNVEPSGRALALYQDLSRAYANGRVIKKSLPNHDRPRRPEKVVQQLMLSCL
jgi:hypothetical protein